MDKFDVCIAGTGVVGLAIAHQLSRSQSHQEKSIVLVDKESSYGQITSSRNSEVIHAGIYYATGSLKASLCVAGKHLLYEHLERFALPFKKLGKLIVAQEDEVDALYPIEQKAIENGVTDLRFVDYKELQTVCGRIKKLYRCYKKLLKTNLVNEPESRNYLKKVTDEFYDILLMIPSI